jgi:5-methylthioadenosine/S-adenosylhomocysteine deaminase
MLEEARFATLLARALGDVVSAKDALEAATLGGAGCLDVDAGQLKEGLQADLTAVSLTGVHQIPNYDPVATLIFSSSGRDVILTVIAGREVFRDGRVAGVDEDQLRARMSEIYGRI